MANMEGGEKSPKFKKQKKREGELNARIKNRKKEIEKNDLEELIIDRSETPEGVNTQIDISADGFQKLGENMEDGEYANGVGGDVLPEGGEMGNPLHENEVDNPRGVERSKVKRGEKALPWKVELDSGGKFPR